MKEYHANPIQDIRKEPQPLPWQLLFLGGALVLAVIGLGLKLAGIL